MYLCRVSAFCIVALLCTLATRAAEPVDLSPVLEQVRAKTKAPGLAAAVMRDGKLVGVGVAGVRMLGEPNAVERSDLLMIGSCGKSLTRLPIGRLVDQGHLRFDAKLGELLPDVPMRDEYKNVTVADLLAHRGGIQPYTELGPKRTPALFQLTGSPQEQRARFVAHLLNEAPAAPPGTRFVYSNAGYGLLGHIAERISQRPFEDVLRELVFVPLAMKSAIVGMPNSGPGHTGLVGHVSEGGEYQPATRQRTPLPPIAPAGMMSCTVDDFVRFAAVLAACEAGKPGDFLKPETAARLREVRPGDKSSEGEPFFGGDGLYTAAFAVWPSKGVAIVVGSNAGDSDEVCSAALDAVRTACTPELAGNTPEAAASEPNRPRFGFAVRVDESESWTVDRVEPGSPAERGGLKVDDRIIAIGGVPLEKLAPAERKSLLRKSPLPLTVERGKEKLDLMLTAD